MISMEAIAWVRKYFSDLYEFNNLVLVIKIGITTIMLISIIVHIKNQLLVDSSIIVLKISEVNII
jgi:low affinity Fe/Cu permease